MPLSNFVLMEDFFQEFGIPGIALNKLCVFHKLRMTICKVVHYQTS